MGLEMGKLSIINILITVSIILQLTSVMYFVLRNSEHYEDTQGVLYRVTPTLLKELEEITLVTVLALVISPLTFNEKVYFVVITMILGGISLIDEVVSEVFPQMVLGLLMLVMSIGFSLEIMTLENLLINSIGAITVMAISYPFNRGFKIIGAGDFLVFFALALMSGVLEALFVVVVANVFVLIDNYNLYKIRRTVGVKEKRIPLVPYMYRAYLLIHLLFHNHILELFNWIARG